MWHDPRDELWNGVFDTYYDAYYNEVLADKLISRWQYFDEITKVLVALTASGSAIAGWTLWSKPGFEFVWVLMAGAAAVLSIIHAALSVADRLKDAGEVRRAFACLRIDIETFRYRMRIDPEFGIDEFTKEFEEYRRRYSDCEQRIKNDIFRTMPLRHRRKASWMRF